MRGYLMRPALMRSALHATAGVVLLAAGALAQPPALPPQSRQPMRTLANGDHILANRLRVTLRDVNARALSETAAGQMSPVDQGALTTLHPAIIDIEARHRSVQQWLRGEQVDERFRTRDGSIPRRARRFDVVLRAGADVLQVRGELQRHPAVERVDLKELLELHAVPDDPLYSQQWAPPLTGLEQAWDVPPQGRVRVAVIDTGLRLSHPEFAGRVVFNEGYGDFDTGEAPTSGADFDHGTHVAGILCATRNNFVGVAGYSNEIDLMVMNCAAWNDDKKKWVVSGADNAIDDAVEHGAVIINCSFEFGSDSLQDEVEDAYDADALVVHAAGNDSQSITGQWHANSHAVLTVTATKHVEPPLPWMPREQVDERYSNFGVGVELAAPGSGIHSTVPGGYDNKDGTSMAAPQVSGAAALLISLNPGRIGDQSARHLLIRMAEDLGDNGYDQFYGHGSLRLRQATLWACRNATAFVSSASTVAETGNYDRPWRTLPAALAHVPDHANLVLNGGTVDVPVYQYPPTTISKPCTLTAIPDRPVRIGVQ